MCFYGMKFHIVPYTRQSGIQAPPEILQKSTVSVLNVSFGYAGRTGVYGHIVFADIHIY